METGRNETRKLQDIKPQACLADENAVSGYGFLVNGKDIKYIAIEPGVFPADDISFEHALKAGLPVFPPGDWNEGHVAKDAKPETWSLYPLCSTPTIWHQNTFDHLELVWTDRLRQNVRLVTCPSFDPPVVYKFAEFPGQIPGMELETTAYYGWIDGHDIGPRFLGHATEAGRAIGFLIDKVTGDTATVADLDACQRVLKRLHALELKHGDVNKHNFLIREGGKAVLIDFKVTARCKDEQERLVELESVRKLEEEDGRGGVVEEG